MNRETHKIQWRQEYYLWPKAKVEPKVAPRTEPELENLAEARAVLARIMSL